MYITKRGKNLIVSIPLRQESYNALGERIGIVPNVVGVIVKGKDDSGMFEQGIYRLNELGYKNDIQLGMPIVMTCMEDDEFVVLCKKLGIDVWEYRKCAKCGNTLFGTHTINNNGELVCRGCEDE